MSKQIHVSRNEVPSTRGPLLLRVCGILGLATLIGLAFNASNPIGVRLRSESAGKETPAPVMPSEPAKPSLASVVAPASQQLSGSSNALVVPTNTTTAVSDTNYVAPSPITWLEVKSLAKEGNVVLVDARGKAFYDAGHIPNAVHMPEDSSADVVVAFREKYGSNAPVVIYCSSEGCSLSFKLAYKLAKDFGFRNVRFMTGGYFEYLRDIGLLSGTNTPPALTGLTAIAASPFTTNTTAQIATNVVVSQVNPQPISWRKLPEWTQEQKAVLVDARSAAEYTAGHVPGALSLPSGSPSARFEDFKKTYGTNRAVVVYGETTGSVKSFLLARQLMADHGFKSVRFLVEGFKQWQTNQEPPPATTR